MNKEKFIDAMSYYCIPQLIFFAIVLFIADDILFYGFCQISGVSYGTALYNFYNLMGNLLLIALWGYVAFTTVRNKHYKKLTDRSYPKDHREFNKSYIELVQFYTNNDPYKMDIEDLPIEDWHTSEGVILCKYKDKSGQYRLVKRDSNANGNLISFGLPGSGKSTTQAATTAVRFNADLKDGGCGVFAISIKGDLLNFVKGKRKNIKVFTPDKVEGSCHYDPLQGLDKMSETDRRSFVENMSMTICPNENGDNAAFFVGGSRDYFCGIVHYLLFLHDTGKEEGTLKFTEIIDTILENDVFQITNKIKSSGCQIAGQYTNSYIGSSEKNTSGVYNHLCKQIRPFNMGALRELFDGEGDCIKPEDLDIGDIYIDVPQEKYDLYAPAMAIIITNFLSAFMQRNDVSSNKETVPIMFLLDEAVQLNLDFTMLSKAMATLRSKKISLFLLMQSVAQLEGTYGEAHAREIIDLCAYISVFNAQDPKSRYYFQSLVGKRKTLKRSTSLSSTISKNNTSGVSVTETDEFIFEAADFGDLNLYNKQTGKTIPRVMVYAKGKYIVGETTPCYE